MWGSAAKRVPLITAVEQNPSCNSSSSLGPSSAALDHVASPKPSQMQVPPFFSTFRACVLVFHLCY